MFSHEPQERLAVEPSDRVLEIGFGGGETLHQLIEKAGFVVGLGRSSDVIRRAKSKFSLAVSCNRAAFQQGGVNALPFEGASFDRVLTVNTVYFWESHDDAFREIHRVLIPQGQMVPGSATAIG